MKFYVASRFKNYRAVRAVVDDLTQRGHACTFDWTRTREFDGNGNLIVENPEEELSPKDKITYALRDRDGAMDADCLVLLWTHDMCGAYIEVGMALAQRIPVYIIGRKERWTIFWALPNVTEFATPIDLFEHLDANGA